MEVCTPPRLKRSLLLARAFAPAACRDFATCIGLEPGKSCNATCFAPLSYFGPGYTATCQADGTFSKPVGECSKRSKCTVPLRDSIDAQW